MSTFDRRRTNGPEESFPPIFESDPTEEGIGLKHSKSRLGRQPTDLRPIYLKTGLTSQANGSAYIETENTKIACAVYGPRQSKNTAYSEKGRLNVELSFAPFSYQRRKVPNKDCEDRPLSKLVHQALLPAIRLEKFPKSNLDVFITVIESDGVENCLASSTIAATTALANAGIEMIGLVVSCSASIMQNGEMWLDPTFSETSVAEGTVTLACIPALTSISSIWQIGKLTPQEVQKCVEKCEWCCTEIHAIVAQSLRESILENKIT